MSFTQENAVDLLCVGSPFNAPDDIEEENIKILSKTLSLSHRMTCVLVAIYYVFRLSQARSQIHAQL
jgi:hypothetical protein